MAFTWSAQYETNISKVDEQHQTIINQINQLLELMKLGKARHELSTLLAFLDTYTKKHFADEEKIMETNKCPMADLNKQQHVIFIANLQEFQARFDKENTSAELTLAVQKELMDWFVNHIVKIDLKMKECVK
jgi:hemerythrin